MSIRNHITAWFIIIVSFDLTAQSLQGLTENPVIKKYRLENAGRLKSVTSLPLSLPFFEDFSTSFIVPDPAKWEDGDVFINNSFAVDPVSIGVATLDAIDENGNVYAMTNYPAVSDMLTSQPFDLTAYAFPDDTVRLSFFYQAGGKGEAPEISDSLILEFYSPSDTEWTRAWFSLADSPTEFKQEIIAISDSLYQNGFRFRFKNYTSISVNDVAGGKGALSNADCWNIDYIMMNTEPASSHISISDITAVEPPRNMMDYYESIPWSHLNYAQSITRNTMHYVIRNLNKGINDSVNVGRNYYVKYLNSGLTEYYDNLFSEVAPDKIDRRNDPFFAPFTRNDNTNEGRIEVGGFLITPAGDYKLNDTAKILIQFKDYYAFDDGTPEYGFGIPGPSTMGALLAMKFRVYTDDTLRAADMLFNKARDYFNADLPFHLCVWDNDNGKPGELIYYSDEEFFPDSSLLMPEFKRYAIDPNIDLVISDSVVYVGIQQFTEEFLNLGYDVNRNSLSSTFVNVSGDWFNPNPGNIPGTVMIRAVFGNKDVVTGEPEIPKEPTDVLLYPNPVSGILHVETHEIRIRQITLYDIYGRKVMQVEGGVNDLDLSALIPGIYEAVLYTDRQQVIVRKIVVSH
jgi:hypothetical protein